MSGMANYRTARVLSEYTENLTFADPVLQLGIPKFLTSLHALELYAAGTHHFMRWSAPHVLTPSVAPIKEWNHFILRKAMQKADVIAARYDELEAFSMEELGGKTILTATVTEERLRELGDKGSTWLWITRHSCLIPLLGSTLSKP